MSCRCINCHRRYPFRAQNPDQKYCGRRICQNKRRQRWRRERIKGDTEYRCNQSDAQERWLEKNPHYWREYRDDHPDYVERNRVQQVHRDNVRRHPQPCMSGAGLLAKSDAWMPDKHDISGHYNIIPVTEAALAKSDASTKKYLLIPTCCKENPVSRPACKDTTRGTLPESTGMGSVCLGPSS